MSPTIARLAVEHLRADIMAEVQRPPQWRINIGAVREMLACRYERRPA
jgi:hypothetical protein